jgi:hypothetical protein
MSHYYNFVNLKEMVVLYNNLLVVRTLEHFFLHELSELHRKSYSTNTDKLFSEFGIKIRAEKIRGREGLVIT